MKASFRKGDLVRPTSHVVGWRDSTESENEAWYEQFREAATSGGQYHLNAAGEIPLPPRYKSFDVNNSTVGIVTRARVADRPRGRRGICEVFWPELGQTLIVPRDHLERVD